MRFRQKIILNGVLLKDHHCIYRKHLNHNALGTLSNNKKTACHRDSQIKTFLLRFIPVSQSI